MPIYALGEERARIHPSAFVHPEAVVIGEVHLGAESSVWPCAVIRADNGPIVVGARTSIQDGAVLHTQPHNPTRVGDDCTIGHLAHLEGCVVEDHCLVGSGAVVLHHAVVRTGALVGAGAVVSNGMEVPSNAMALGVPAKIRPDSVNDGAISLAVEAYVANVDIYKSGLRRLDG